MDKPNHYIHKKQPATYGYDPFLYIRNFYLVKTFLLLGILYRVMIYQIWMVPFWASRQLDFHM